MFHVITGGSGSGKSAYAEGCIMRYHQPDLPLYYIATMEPYGQEMENKIKRHRDMRAGKVFRTIECYKNLENATNGISLESKKGSILLECMSNLVANEFYQCVLEAEQNGRSLSDEIEEIIALKVCKGVFQLRNHCENLVVVTNEVFSAKELVSKEMIHYKIILSKVNGRLAAKADRVTEVVYGIPIDLGE